MTEDTDDSAEVQPLERKTWEHVFDSPGKKKITINSNLKDVIQVIKDKTKIIDVTIGDGVSAIHQGCFKGFTELSSVRGGKNCKTIGDSAFKGCTSLSVCDMLGANFTKFQHVGAEAFANTAFRDVNIWVDGSDVDNSLGERAFSGCLNLRTANIQHSESISDKCFDGCKNLSQIAIKDTTRIGKEAFHTCRSIETVNIPDQVANIDSCAFDGCSSLTGIVFQGNNLRRLGNGVFNGCSGLSAITVPRSISSMWQIGDNFLSGSNVLTVYMNGLDDKNAKEEITTKKIDMDQYGYITSREGIIQAYNDANERGVPLVVITNYYLHPKVKQHCAWCEALTLRVLGTEGWNSFMKRYRNNCYFVYASFFEDEDFWRQISYGDEIKGNIFPNWFKKDKYGYFYYRQTDKTPGPKDVVDHFAKMLLYWNDPQRSTPLISQIDPLNGDFNYVDGKRISQTREQYIENIIKTSKVQINEIQETRSSKLTKFGSPLNSIKVVSKTNTFYTVGEDIETPEEFVPPVPDSQETEDFQPGKWYSSAKNLKKYVDDNRVPCLAVFSESQGLQRFKSEIYNNYNFQKWVKEQIDIRFCLMETNSFQDFQTFQTDQYYMYSTWAKRTKEQTPVAIYYWKTPYGLNITDTIWNIESLSNTNMDYKQFINNIWLNLYGEEYQEDAYHGMIKPGIWINATDQLLDVAERDHIPVVIVASASGCIRCADFKSQIMSNEKFKTWVSNSPYLFCYAYSGSGWFTTKPLRRVMDIVGDGGQPRVGGYWKKEDGSIVGGKSVTTSVGASVDFYINKFDTLFQDYKPKK